MQVYEPLKHEMLVLQWHLNLKTEPEEYDKIFADQNHTLTNLLSYVSSSVILGFEMDKGGIWAACWVEPCLNAAWFSSWIRKDKRHTKSALKFINEAYARVLDKFPTIMGLTSQPDLADLHIKLGYNYGCRIPGMFNGKDALLFVMTRETREARKHGNVRRQRENGQQHTESAESIRAVLGENGPEVVPGREQLSPAIPVSVKGSAANGRRKFPDTSHKRKSRVRKGGSKPKHASRQRPSIPSRISE